MAFQYAVQLVALGGVMTGTGCLTLAFRACADWDVDDWSGLDGLSVSVDVEPVQHRLDWGGR